METLRLLQIEDSETDSLLIQRLLSRGGYEVAARRVETAQELREALKDSEWDVMIADYTLPGFGAPAALQIAQETGLDIPFIVVSGSVGDETAVAMLKLGAHDYVMKDRLNRLVPAVQREIREALSRRQQRQDQELLKQSERRLNLALEASRMGVWEWMPETNHVFWSRECYRIAGLKEFNNRLEGFEELVHPDDRATVLRAMAAALDTHTAFEAEFRIVRPPGDVRWIRNLASTIYNDQGNPVLMTGTVEDITVRRSEIAAHEEILGRLEAVREEDRHHIAREIHDELGQALTLLQYSTHDLECAVRDRKVKDGLAHLERHREQIGGIVQQVREIATKLHPAILDRLGLSPALEWLSERFTKTHSFKVTLQLPPQDPTLTPAEKIVFFRIVQEALTNVARHSQATTVGISLARAGKQSVLKVSDNGAGFDTTLTRDTLGVLGMRERARGIHAWFSIVSSPGQGTCVTLVSRGG